MFQVPAVQFAVASDSNYAFSGIMGLGYTYPYTIAYPSVLNLMVQQKLIGAPIFSVGLGGEMDGFSKWQPLQLYPYTNTGKVRLYSVV